MPAIAGEPIMLPAGSVPDIVVIAPPGAAASRTAAPIGAPVAAPTVDIAIDIDDMPIDIVCSAGADVTSHGFTFACALEPTSAYGRPRSSFGLNGFSSIG